MSTTSSAVKRRYNSKTYKRFTADLRNEVYDEIEEARGDMSRAAFLLMLFREHQERQKSDN